MNRDLLFRVATALVLLPLVIWFIWLGGIWFALLVGGAAALCSLELNLLPFAAPPAAPPLEEVSRKQEDGSRKERQKARAAADTGPQDGGLSGCCSRPTLRH